LFTDEKLQAVMEVSDLGTADPQSNSQSPKSQQEGSSDLASLNGSIDGEEESKEGKTSINS